MLPRRPAWHRLRNKATRGLEAALRQVFEQVDAYQYNSGTIRLRIVDSKFELLTRARVDAAIESAIREYVSTDVQTMIPTFVGARPSDISNPRSPFIVPMQNAMFEQGNKRPNDND